jgi:hypothetical protein
MRLRPAHGCDAGYLEHAQAQLRGRPPSTANTLTLGGDSKPGAALTRATVRPMDHDDGTTVPAILQPSEAFGVVGEQEGLTTVRVVVAVRQRRAEMTRPRAREHGGGAPGRTWRVTTPLTSAPTKRRRAPALGGQGKAIGAFNSTREGRRERCPW